MAGTLELQDRTDNKQKLSHVLEDTVGAGVIALLVVRLLPPPATHSDEWPVNTLLGKIRAGSVNQLSSYKLYGQLTHIQLQSKKTLESILQQFAAGGAGKEAVIELACTSVQGRSTQQIEELAEFIDEQVYPGVDEHTRNRFALASSLEARRLIRRLQLDGYGIRQALFIVANVVQSGGLATYQATNEQLAILMNFLRLCHCPESSALIEIKHITPLLRRFTDKSGNTPMVASFKSEGRLAFHGQKAAPSIYKATPFLLKLFRSKYLNNYKESRLEETLQLLRPSAKPSGRSTYQRLLLAAQTGSSFLLRWKQDFVDSHLEKIASKAIGQFGEGDAGFDDDEVGDEGETSLARASLLHPSQQPEALRASSSLPLRTGLPLVIDDISKGELDLSARNNSSPFDGRIIEGTGAARSAGSNRPRRVASRATACGSSLLGSSLSDSSLLDSLDASARLPTSRCRLEPALRVAPVPFISDISNSDDEHQIFSDDEREEILSAYKRVLVGKLIREGLESSFDKKEILCDLFQEHPKPPPDQEGDPFEGLEVGHLRLLDCVPSDKKRIGAGQQDFDYTQRQEVEARRVKLTKKLQSLRGRSKVGYVFKDEFKFLTAPCYRTVSGKKTKIPCNCASELLAEAMLDGWALEKDGAYNFRLVLKPWCDLVWA